MVEDNIVLMALDLLNSDYFSIVFKQKVRKSVLQETTNTK